jgi:hypothetical protein
VRRHFDQHSLSRRIVAIAAAYLLALSAIVANFAAARLAAETIDGPPGVTCHADGAGTASSSGDQGDTGRCIDNCSICCLSLAALPPPAPVHSAALPIPAAWPFAAPAIVRRLDSTSYRSRAPPQAA